MTGQLTFQPIQLAAGSLAFSMVVFTYYLKIDTNLALFYLKLVRKGVPKNSLHILLSPHLQVCH